MPDIDLKALQSILDNAASPAHVQYDPLPADITVEVAIATVVQCSGNIRHAAEQLSCAAPQLLALIASDPASSKIMAAQMRVMVMIGMADVFSRTQIELINNMDELEPKDVLRAYGMISQQMVAITDSKETTSNINISEHIMRMLPPGARSLMLEMIQTPEEPEEVPPYMLLEHDD